MELHDPPTVLEPGSAPAPIRERGSTIGRYVLLQRLGEGGMGVVYEAFDPQLDRNVAIKLLRPGADFGTGESRGGAERLLREARLMASLAHPNIVRVYDAGEFEGGVFLAMELVHGATLRHHVIRRGPDWHALLAIFVAAARGLAAAHEAGLVHRDFKPDNLLIGDDGTVRVADFGLARPVGGFATPVVAGTAPGTGLTQTGTILGTPAYMAPEQMLGRPANSQSDQFSFCASFWEAIYGVRPFAGNDVDSIGRSITRQEFQPPHTARLAPRWLRRALQRGLSPEPMARHPSMLALAGDIAGRDRRVRRAWRFSAGLGVMAIATLAFWAARADSENCTEETAHAVDVWSTGDRARLRESIIVSDATDPAMLVGLVLSRAQAWIDRWRAVRISACRAAESGTTSRALGESSAACLDSALDDFAQAIDIADSDGQSDVDHLIDRLAGLPDPRQCAQRSLTRVSMEDIEILAKNMPEFHAEIIRAEAARDDVSAARAWISLFEATGSHEQEARAAISRVGDDPALQAALQRALAGRAPDPSQARAHWLRSRDLTELAGGAEQPALISDLQSLAKACAAAGSLDEALAHQTRALSLSELVYGPHHPRVAEILMDMAITMRASGELAAANAAEARLNGIQSRNLPSNQARAATN